MKMTIKLATSVASILSLAVVVNSATAQSTPSGLLLGIYASPVVGGLRVDATIPGTSADRLLLPGDVLTRASDGTWIFPIRSHSEIEYFKSRVGAGRAAAIELFRPGKGVFVFYVQFQLTGGSSRAHFYSGKNSGSMFKGKKQFIRKSK